MSKFPMIFIFTNFEEAKMIQCGSMVSAVQFLIGFLCLQKMQETFAEYTARTAFERPLLSGVAYAQRVVNSERESFERQNGWTIKTMEREPSPIRDEYAPVIFSQETVSYIESIDMMSGEVIIWMV